MAALIARDMHNVSAALRVGGPMKHKNTPRGGARNESAEWLAEARDEMEAEEAERAARNRGTE